MEGDILGFEGLVRLDSLAASIASGSTRRVPVVSEFLRIGLDQGQVVAHAVGAFLAVNGVDFDIDVLEAAGNRIFKQLGPVEEQGDRALAPIVIAHPFEEAGTAEVRVELARSPEGWRVVGLRGLTSLSEILDQPSPEARVRSALRNLASWEEIHYADAHRYSSDTEELDFEPSEGVSVEIGTSEDGNSWWATAQWDDDPGYSCAVFYGALGLAQYSRTNMGLGPILPGDYYCDPYRVLAYDYFR